MANSIKLTPFFIAAMAASMPILLSSCAHRDHVSQANKNQFITEFYAHVQYIEEVEFESHAGEAAASWGVLGALENSRGDSGDIIGGAIIGAMLGGLLTSLFEGSREGYQYQLEAIDGDSVTVLLDYYPANVGDCVFVRVGSEVDIYKSPANECEGRFDEAY